MAAKKKPIKKKAPAKKRKTRDITELITGKRKTKRKKDKFLF